MSIATAQAQAITLQLDNEVKLESIDRMVAIGESIGNADLYLIALKDAVRQGRLDAARRAIGEILIELRLAANETQLLDKLVVSAGA